MKVQRLHNLAKLLCGSPDSVAGDVAQVVNHQWHCRNNRERKEYIYIYIYIYYSKENSLLLLGICARELYSGLAQNF